MIDAPVSGLLHVWGQLTEALHGVNGYGGNDAEIYAYTLMARCPTREVPLRPGSSFCKEHRAAEVVAHETLVELCRRFAAEHDCTVTILDGDPGHRWHVRVERS